MEDVCEECGRYGKINRHHLSSTMTVVLCLRCHQKVHADFHSRLNPFRWMSIEAISVLKDYAEPHEMPSDTLDRVLRLLRKDESSRMQSGVLGEMKGDKIPGEIRVAKRPDKTAPFSLLYLPKGWHQKKVLAVVLEDQQQEEKVREINTC